MAKTCTDYKQIDRLVELGFDLSTTDMFCTEEGGASNFPICSSDGEKYYREAWSLAALLQLLPEVIKSEGKYGWSFDSLHIMQEHGRMPAADCWSLLPEADNRPRNGKMEVRYAGKIYDVVETKALPGGMPYLAVLDKNL